MDNPFAPYGGVYRGSGPSSRPGAPWPAEEPRGGPPPGVPLGRPGQDMWDYERAPPKRLAPDGYSGPSPPPKPRKNTDEPVHDCEVVAVGDPDPGYVAAVKKGIRDFHLKVGVMFLTPTVKVSSFIESLAMRGAIFAVVIRPENEAHRSVSVHILRGPPKPEEHRNMPLATAFTLIQNRYLDLRKKEIGPIPEEIKAIFKYILEDRCLTDTEYGMVIAFLQDRRKRQADFENRSPHDVPRQIYNQEELQRKILAIISGAEPLHSSRSDRSIGLSPTNPVGKPL